MQKIGDKVATLPSELAAGPALHSLVRVELTNNTVIVGRITEMDASTMNIKLDAITRCVVRRPQDGDEAEEQHPVAMRCVNGVVVRGACIRYIDFISEAESGGRGLEDIMAVAEAVRPTPA